MSGETHFVGSWGLISFSEYYSFFWRRAARALSEGGGPYLGHLGWGGGWGGEHGKNLTQDAENHHPKHPTQGPLSGPLPSPGSRASGPVQSGGLQPSGVLTTGRVTLGQLPAVLIPHDSQSCRPDFPDHLLLPQSYEGKGWEYRSRWRLSLSPWGPPLHTNTGHRGCPDPSSTAHWGRL